MGDYSNYSVTSASRAEEPRRGTVDSKGGMCGSLLMRNNGPVVVNYLRQSTTTNAGGKAGDPDSTNSKSYNPKLNQCVCMAMCVL